MFSADDLCVIAAVDNPTILAACLERSPDIASGRLPLVTMTGAASMAQAYNGGMVQTDAAICLFAHQDVYLPAGFLDRALTAINRLGELYPDWLAAGAFGVTADSICAGRIWDVTMGQELGSRVEAPVPVVSFDELLLIVRRERGFAFDPQLPHFHLYGTDLAQTALEMGRTAWVIDLPVVHNNRPIASLGGGYLSAYRYARRKWRGRLPIPTTICALSHNPIPLLRARWRRRHVRVRPDALGADSVEIARAAGYE